MREITSNLFAFGTDEEAARNYHRRQDAADMHSRLIKRRDRWFVWHSRLAKYVLANILRYRQVMYCFTIAWMTTHSTRDLSEAIDYARAHQLEIQAVHLVNVGPDDNEAKVWQVVDRLTLDEFLSQYASLVKENNHAN